MKAVPNALLVLRVLISDAADPLILPLVARKNKKWLVLFYCKGEYLFIIFSVFRFLYFSISTVFKICRQKMCRFRVNGRPIRRIFHRFHNVPASCERI